MFPQHGIEEDEPGRGGLFPQHETQEAASSTWLTTTQHDDLTDPTQLLPFGCLAQPAPAPAASLGEDVLVYSKKRGRKSKQAHKKKKSKRHKSKKKKKHKHSSSGSDSDSGSDNQQQGEASFVIDAKGDQGNLAFFAIYEKNVPHYALHRGGGRYPIMLGMQGITHAQRRVVLGGRTTCSIM